MANAKRLIRFYRAQFRLSVSSELEYKGAVWLWALVGMLQPLVTGFVWIATSESAQERSFLCSVFYCRCGFRQPDLGMGDVGLPATHHFGYILLVSSDACSPLPSGSLCDACQQGCGSSNCPYRRCSYWCRNGCQSPSEHFGCAARSGCPRPCCCSSFCSGVGLGVGGVLDGPDGWTELALLCSRHPSKWSLRAAGPVARMDACGERIYPFSLLLRVPSGDIYCADYIKGWTACYHGPTRYDLDLRGARPSGL